MSASTTVPGTGDTLAVLYEKQLNNSGSFPELLLNGVGEFTADGLQITGKEDVAKLDKFYAIAERKVQYLVSFSADAKAVFRSSEGDFIAYVDVQHKRISIATSPGVEETVNFLQADRDYLVEVYHIYQQAKLRITDVLTGEAAEIAVVHDGQGGVGKGVLQQGFNVGMQWDRYCFGLAGGASMTIKKIAVYALKKKVKLLIYGDSITQPEGYFPSKDFPLSWTQRIIRKLKGDAMSSGRGGATIDMVLEYIQNELPYIEAEYVMVTIGTNGGNTAPKLTQLVDYIKSRGAIPILNNIPCNESATQIAENLLIEEVRRQSGIKGCKFDLATSLPDDGKVVDKSMMYWEDYSGSYGWQIYHHPNEKGGATMYERTLSDVPEIYE
ncbi:SGNH/GDSL hydrolase family protein [Anseongella ginsenosidimutans]|nr:SGNH/GDSL hydrolase family protein [Anseongella ginsenosidimutans]